jgi:hypothetical protein
VQNLPASQSNPQAATNPPAQASVANLAAAKPAVATTGAAVNAVVKLVEAKDAAKLAMSVLTKSRATPHVPTAPKALADVAEAIAPTDAVAKRLPRQKLTTQLFQPRLWPQAAKPPSARRVKKPTVAVVVVDAVNAQVKPRQTHNCP